MSDLHFQYCPKIIVFSADKQSVLLARRANEVDYNDLYTFIGGKTQNSDGSLLAGLKREKEEEIGKAVKLKICWLMSCYQVWYVKKDGNYMVLPHHVAVYQGGDIKLNPDEYADYKWVKVKDIDKYDQVFSTPLATRNALRLLSVLNDDDFSAI